LNEVISEDLVKIKVAKEDVARELAELQEAIKKGFITKQNAIVRDLLKVYGHIQHGGEIIDIAPTFKKAGLDEDGHPRLAIVRSDAKFCYCAKKNNGSAIYSRDELSEWRPHPRKTSGDLLLPPATFQWLNNTDRYIKTAVPIIPARVYLAVSTRLLPEHYHILFEVESWKKHEPQPPRDPILGKLLTQNLFGVLAHWELTDLEAKILEGRL